MKAEAIVPQVNRAMPLSFRLKLSLLLMLVVTTVTLLALYVTQRTEQASAQQSLHDDFQSRLGFLLGAQETRQAEVAEQCRLLARNVRISAALEEDPVDIDDLYAVAEVELRDVLEHGAPDTAPREERLPRARFFRFLKADGTPLNLPGDTQPWEGQLISSIDPDKQQIGYAAIPATGGDTEINEVIMTPIRIPESEGSEELFALVLGFPPTDLAIKPVPGIMTGICFAGQLHLSALTTPERQVLAGEIANALRTPTAANDSLEVRVGGEPYLLFYKILNPGSRYPPAYEVCLYSLSSSLARQERLRWRILGLGFLVLVVGLGASHFFSARLSQPVEQLVEVSAQNVARREQAEAELELTEQKYRSIFENAVEGIFLLAPDGRCLSANPAMARIFGYDSPAQLLAEMTGSLARLYVDPQQGAELLRRTDRDGTISNFECEMRCRDGRVIWISQNARAVRDGNSGLAYIEGTIEDITGRKQSADSLRTLNAELAHALAELKDTQNQVIRQERLRALGQMASGIAHDFNNSLMPVMGFAELLLAHPAILDDKKKATGYLEMIRTAAKDAASIVSRLREFYRTNENSDVFTPVNLQALSRQAVSLTEPKWKGQAQASGAEIHLVEELGDVPPISGDESALREVLTNLIFNAVDAMPHGGTITLRTRREGDRAVLEVADTGAGMTEEVRQRCLEPFFTTKGDRGTGLGLAMVFGIVQRHDGTIDIRTQLGRGTTFLIQFPLRAPSSRQTAALPSVQVQKALRVLLVDDDPQVREVLTAFLEVEGHGVQAAETGLDGLRQFREGEFDLVITDKAMPGLSGDQMAIEIKRLSPAMPVILLSGFNSTGEDEKIPGVDVIACKPITMPSLREAITRAMKPA